MALKTKVKALLAGGAGAVAIAAAMLGGMTVWKEGATNPTATLLGLSRFATGIREKTLYPASITPMRSVMHY